MVLIEPKWVNVITGTWRAACGRRQVLKWAFSLVLEMSSPSQPQEARQEHVIWLVQSQNHGNYHIMTLRWVRLFVLFDFEDWKDVVRSSSLPSSPNAYYAYKC